MTDKFVKAATTEVAKGAEIGSITLRVETFVSKPIYDKQQGPYNTYGKLLDEFIVEQVTAGNRVVGFEMELSPDAANSLVNTIQHNNYYNDSN